MNQILHIFRKDIRHHWIVILLCQAALVAYCWMVVTGWNDQENFGFNAVSGIIRLLPAMIWCLFFLRVVQDESLVGDRQFWVTRPYEWKKLLAEKILFVLVFLNLPLLIAGTVLLIKAGFSPAPHFLGLLWMQVLLFHLPFLPLLALATVTRNLVQGLVTLFAGLLASTAISILPLYFSLGSTRFAAVAVSVPVDVHYHSGDLRDLLLLVVCIAAIGLQYAFRKTAQSRLWLVGGVLAMVAIDLISGYATRNRDPFPVPARETVEFHAAVNTAKLAPPKRPVETNESVLIGIPMNTSGLPQGSVGSAKGMRLVLEAPDGFRWDGRWPGDMLLLTTGGNQWQAMFQIDHEAYERLRSSPLKARVSLSVDVFREHDFESVEATGEEFNVPRVGRCRIWGRERRSIRCNSPLVPPSTVIVRFDPARSTCVAEDNVVQVPLRGMPYAWHSERRSGWPAYGISPVSTFPFYFWQFDNWVRICPGTPLNVSLPEFVENVRRDFEIVNFKVDEFRRPDFSSEGIKDDNGVRIGLEPPPRY